MNLLIATLALSATSSVHARHVFRAMQEEGGDGLTIVAGEGVEEAEAPPPSDPTITVPDYSSDQCSDWLAGVMAADTDNSGGLNEEEFHDFLTAVPEPPYIANFFDQQSDSYLNLPWMFKVIHKSLACRCIDLGMGEDCCKGANAEIPLEAILNPPEDQSDIAAEYRADLCNSVAAVFEEAIPAPEPTVSPTISPAPTAANATKAPTVESATTVAATVEEQEEETAPPPVPAMILDVVGSVIDYSSFDYATITDGDETNNDEVPEYYDAEDIMTNKDENGILGEVIKSFGKLANELLSDGVTAEGKKMRSLLRAAAMARLLQKASIDPVVVTDIPCPENLTFAPNGTYCLNFKFTVEPDPLSEQSPEAFVEMYTPIFEQAINEEGRMYEILIADYPESGVYGLGSPGGGKDYQGLTVDASESVDSSTEESPAGLSAGAIVVIILAVILVPMATIAMYARYRKVQEEERLKKLQAYEERQANRDGDLEDNSGSIYSDPNNRAPVARSAPTAGSQLAAIGTAGTAAAYAGKKMPDKDDKIKAEIRTLVEETKAPKSAEELLAAYDGREQELLSHLQTMKKKNGMKAEVEQLVKDTNSPKSAEELLAAYKGREDELVRNLRKLKSKKDEKEEIAKLVAETSPGKTADELLALYAGREDELKRNLVKMKSKKESKREIESLVEETQPGKTSDELLAVYAGREDELKKNLLKMKSKQESKKAVVAEVKELVDGTQPGKSAEELLASYSGREEELVKNLRKMKSKQEVKAEIVSLVEETQPGKTADELLASYSGREEELKKNLVKMKSKQESMRSTKDTTKAIKSEPTQESTEVIKSEIKSLVAVTQPGKTADELLNAYAGREEELKKNLVKMKSKKDVEKVESLVATTNPGKSSKELLEAYEGREDELIKNLEKMKAKQTKALVKSLVETTNPGKSTKELLEAYEGREDELIKNLEKMKAKQEKQASKAAAPQAAAAPAQAAAAPVQSAPSDEIRSKVASLVSETNPGKSASDLLDAYQGRESELINHLEKLKKSKSKSQMG